MSSITIDKKGAVFTLRLVGVLLLLAFMYQGWQFLANDYFGDEQFAMIPEALGVFKHESQEEPIEFVENGKYIFLDLANSELTLFDELVDPL